MFVNNVQIVNFSRVGELPEHVLNYEWRTSLIFAIDLSILLPTMIVSGVLLLKAEAWGFVLSVVMLFKMSTYGLALLAMVLTSASKGFDPLLPFYLLICMGGTFFLTVLFRSMKRLT